MTTTIVRYSSAFVFATAIGVLAGYALEYPVAVRWIPEGPPMPIPTAFCFIAESVALFALSIHSADSRK